MVNFHYWQILLTLILTGISGFAYHYGGSEGGKRWVREVVDGLCIILWLSLCIGFNPWVILIMGTIWIESTYFKIFGKTNLFTWNLVGLSFSLVVLPYIIAMHDVNLWIGFIIRTILLTPTVGFIVQYFGGKVGFSEGFRGGIQIISLPLLLVWRLVMVLTLHLH